MSLYGDYDPENIFAKILKGEMPYAYTSGWVYPQIIVSLNLVGQNLMTYSN